MSVSVFSHPWLGGYFGDQAIENLWSGERQLGHMLAFEAAWSRVMGQAGLFDRQAAEKAARIIETTTIEPCQLRAGMAEDGVPVPTLVTYLKRIAPAEAVHKGATSQDVVDTALALTLKGVTGILLQRISTLRAALAGLDSRFGTKPMMGRTRMQAARIISVRDRLKTWQLPLADHAERLDRLRKRVERVQIGGAVGDRAALGDKADRVVAAMASTLGLEPTAKAWHAMRDGIADYAATLSLVTGTLGKMGQDITLMAQQGFDEIVLVGGGSSSAMPEKNNPVLAELLVTLARFNAVQLSGMHQALVHEQERSGAAWSLEWMILPQMTVATGRSLAAAITLCGKIERIGLPEPRSEPAGGAADTVRSSSDCVVQLNAFKRDRDPLADPDTHGGK
ncbi:3-carboxy-cis,cis-muconate cycloisomerase [Martelella alba]|uniref:3-carboxy-cis,cis-muconate cycloisomerase n=1 Tax=Martelella alba TaxID=2590451 RepID=A0A506UDT6_9HYPH|nr:3-carboxy-cis,cis-muconate cycloisomerase [Martelella alba]TPW31556.1 3-carboxy-cis,cis-muconate cycloisomerase [Martelella alba]